MWRIGETTWKALRTNMLQTLKKVESYCHALLDKRVKSDNGYLFILKALQACKKEDLPLKIINRAKLRSRKKFVSAFIAECEDKVRRDKTVYKALYKDPVEACEYVFFEVMADRRDREEAEKWPKLVLVKK